MLFLIFSGIFRNQKSVLFSHAGPYPWWMLGSRNSFAEADGETFLQAAVVLAVEEVVVLAASAEAEAEALAAAVPAGDGDQIGNWKNIVDSRQCQ